MLLSQIDNRKEFKFVDLIRLKLDVSLRCLGIVCKDTVRKKIQSLAHVIVNLQSSIIKMFLTY